MQTEICSQCLFTKDINEFGKYTIRGKVHHRRACNACRRKQSAERYAKNPDVQTKMKATAKAYRFKKLYGLSLDALNNLETQSNGQCAICSSKRKLQVDHDHKTGKVRGLLCFSCNVGIGNFKENEQFLERAILYLKN